MSNRDMLVVLSGPSGVGKTTIGKLIEKDSRLNGLIKKVPTCTTRPPRPGEEDGKDYMFLSRAEFAVGLSEGIFLEWVEIFGNFYGTSKREVDRILKEGKIPLLIIDVRGGRYVKSLYKDDVLTIFIMPPSEEELRRRLVSRSDLTEEELSLRLGIAHEEILESSNYDYIVVNDDLGLAVNKVVDIIEKELTRRSEDDRGKDLGKDTGNL